MILSGNDVISAYSQTSLTSPSLMTSGQQLAVHEGIAVHNVAEGRVVVPAGNSMSPKSTGATVHHLGPTDLRESPFANLLSQLQSDSSRPSVGIVSDQRLLAEPSTDNDTQARKRIKLEPQYDVSSLPSTPLFYRTLYINSRENELSELHSLYKDHISELFFLENNGNLMDYIAWSKRPNIHLSRLLQSTGLDNTDETKAEEDVCDVCCAY